MTVVIWDGKTLASDRRITSGHTISTSIKIYRVQEGIIGFAGNVSSIHEFLDWFQNDRHAITFPEKLKSEETGVQAIFIDKNKKIWQFDYSPSPFQITQKYAAIGSGDESALVAMECGKSAEQAVKVVCKFNSSCGGGVDMLRL